MRKRFRPVRHIGRTARAIVGLAILSAIVVAFMNLGKWQQYVKPALKDAQSALGIDSSASTDTTASKEASTSVDSVLKVHMIDVGNADSLLIQNGNHAMLIDAGENSDGRTVVSYLQRQDVRKLDLCVATHAHADHIGGMDDVIDTFLIDNFLMAKMPAAHTPTSATYKSMLTSLQKRQVKVTNVKPGLQYTLGEAKVDVLGPAATFDDMNNMSVIVKVTFGKQKFLFMGDAEKESEQALLNSGADLSADVLKVGHHGSSSSSTKAFLNKVNPHYALITCGKDNPYGHPAQQTLTALQTRLVSIYRADVYGNVVLTSDGSKITVDTQKHR